MNRDIRPETMQIIARAFLRHRALARDVFDENLRSTYEYALRLASLDLIQTRGDQIIDLTAALANFRTWLHDAMFALSVDAWHYPAMDQLKSTAQLWAWTGQWSRQDIIQFYPKLARELRETLYRLYRQCPGLDEFSLQDWMMEKKLVLALGGGGGTGFIHLPLFQALDEAKIQPSLIMGTSMGSVLGYFRALQVNYDAAMSVLSIPSLWGLTRHSSPCIGDGRHGLKGMMRFNFAEMLLSVSQKFGYERLPSFSELKIPFGCISSGIVKREDIDEELDNQPRGLLASIWKTTTFTWRFAAQRLISVARRLDELQATRRIILGFDPLTKDLTAADGIAFSSLVPGVLSYEVPANHYNSREILDALFAQEKLYRLCDGGLSSNVPVEAAILAGKKLKLSAANRYVLGHDVFAPQKRDGFFYPLQQIANANAIRDAAFSDAFLRQKELLSPVTFSPSLKQMRWLGTEFNKSFTEELRVIRYALQPLRPLAALDLLSF